MRAREFAERILRATSLEEKLVPPPSSLSYAGVGTLPAWLDQDPCRPPELAFGGAGGRARARPRFDTPGGRLELLHAFANHELQALELMALALLRFGDTPAAFQRGLVQTLAEEQRHLSLYVSRVEALGGALGEFPCSDAFWRCMAPQTEPAGFLAAMALTFEQANLDFASYYAARFAEAGDGLTRDVLETVIEDEIGHVAFGLRWFRRWQPPAESLFDGHVRCLVPPLQVVRARGLGFDREARTRAGLPAEYIEQLARVGGSKGALPILRWFNPAAEHEVSGGMGYTPPAGVRAAIEDLDVLMMLPSKPADVVIVRRQPRHAFLEQLKVLRLPTPRFIEADPSGPPWSPSADHEVLGGLEPWGASPRTEFWSAAARARLNVHGHDGATFTAAHRRLYDKRSALEMAASLAADDPEPWWIAASELGEAHQTADAAEAALARVGGWHRGPVVIKAPLGTAGRSMIRVVDGRLTVPQRGWVASTLRRQGAVVVEPWLERIADLSFRLTVDGEGARVDNVGRFLTDRRGQYRGAVLGAPGLGLETRVQRALHDDGRDGKRLSRAASRVADVVGCSAVEAGYRGPVGVDALLYRRDGKVALRPIVEINPRLNMGHLAAILTRRVATGRAALWAWVRRGDVEAAGYPDFSQWWSRTASQHPPQTEARGGRQRLTEGVVATNDPAVAREVVTVVVVGDTLEACAQTIGWRGLRS